MESHVLVLQTLEAAFETIENPQTSSQDRQEAEAVLLARLQRRLERAAARVEKIENLPAGNFYCLWCDDIGFCLEMIETGVAPEFCADCNTLFGLGLL